MIMQSTAAITVLSLAVIVADSASTDRVQEQGVHDQIKKLCCAIRDADQVVYNALDMRHKPSRDKELLRKYDKV